MHRINVSSLTSRSAISSIANPITMITYVNPRKIEPANERPLNPAGGDCVLKGWLVKWMLPKPKVEATALERSFKASGNTCVF